MSVLCTKPIELNWNDADAQGQSGLGGDTLILEGSWIKILELKLKTGLKFG